MKAIIYKSGKFYFCEEWPDATDFVDQADDISRYNHDDFKKAEQQALSTAILISNQEEAISYLLGLDFHENAIKYFKENFPYEYLGEWEIEEACSSDSCSNDGGCEHCKEPIKLVTLKF